jgi:predicted N-acyltransferase
MQTDIQVAHSVEEIGQEAWDRLSANLPFASYRWYRYGEMVLADSEPVYIVLHQQGEAIARGTFWLRTQEQLPIPSVAIRRLIETMLKRRPLLLCQTPLAGTSGLILPDEPSLREAALKTIVELARDQAEQHRVSFTVYDYLEHHETKYDGWPAEFLTARVSEPGTRLIVTWPDFESYLKRLGPQTRRSYRRNRKHADTLGVETKRHPMTQALDELSLDQALALIRNVETSHGASPYPWARAMLRNAYMVDAVWLTAEVDGHLAACGLLLGDRDVREMKLLGLDYKTRYAYFEIVYAAIHCAIEQGVRTVWGGSGAYDLKRRMGFGIADNSHAVFGSTSPLLRGFGRWASKMA